MAKKKSNASLWIMLAAIVAIAVLIFLLPSCGDGMERTTRVAVGQQAPDFTVEMTDSTHVTLSGLRGRVVLLNFWAPWCPPCRSELQRVQSGIVDRFAGRPFVFLPVSREEERGTVEEFLRRNGHAFPSGLDPERTVYALYATNYIPRNFLIDREGRIAGSYIGYTPEEFGELVRAIENELNKP